MTADFVSKGLECSHSTFIKVKLVELHHKELVVRSRDKAVFWAASKEAQISGQGGDCPPSALLL